jgi:hypothetical protein
MRIAITCNYCADNREGEVLSNFWFVPLTDKGVYRSICPKGHRTVTILQQMRFEVLAETAVQAILDGYTREAVSSFAASIERFYEYYSKAVLLTRGVQGPQLLESWKSVRLQSERQLGMFAALFLLEENRPAPLLPHEARDAGSVKFRNSVTHQGYIPTESEAVSFGQAVIDIVETVIGFMGVRYQAATDSILQNYYALARAELEADEQATVSFMFHQMVYRLVPGENDAKFDLAAELATRRGRIARRLSVSTAARHG